MRILFIENRSATWLWASIAQELCRQGHEIHWIVQNKLFTPSFGTIHLLPVPSRKEKRVFGGDDLYADIRRTDRSVLYFGLSGDHYAHYDYQIGKVLDSVRPDFIFGEVTQFHELLTIRHARRLRVPFLSPNATRYPTGRMCFFAFDTLNEVGGEGGELGDDEANEMLSAIAARKIVPAYIENVSRKSWVPLAWRTYSHARLLIGWALGERFVTPSPWRRLMLERDHALQHKRWEGFAAHELPGYLAETPWVLYPLQMQPESNIDIFGQPWNDQAQIIQRAARALTAVGGTLVVKPNPKSKYELSSKLCNVVVSEPNIIALSHDVLMSAIFHSAPLVLTVTGTILLESIFAGKPVASLGEHAMTRYPGVTALDNPEQLAAVLQGVLDGRIVGATRTEALSLLKFLHRTSYPAQIWDPIARPELMNREQRALLIAAFTDVLSSAQDAVALSVP